ncbi:hypothetical protein [Kamptonema formosum]|uniref:hypothetical protein n=1 Tax=Kamptonema formosum TaxID=331992 RepID=UPI0003458613|nr:hypothetical protein [Oscillatoria sp. PCC 10802]
MRVTVFAKTGCSPHKWLPHQTGTLIVKDPGALVPVGKITIMALDIASPFLFENSEIFIC